MTDISQKTVLAAAGKAVATINASHAVISATAAQIAQERAGQPTSGPGAVLVGGTEPVAT